MFVHSAPVEPMLPACWNNIVSINFNLWPILKITFVRTITVANLLLIVTGTGAALPKSISTNWDLSSVNSKLPGYMNKNRTEGNCYKTRPLQHTHTHTHTHTSHLWHIFNQTFTSLWASEPEEQLCIAWRPWQAERNHLKQSSSGIFSFWRRLLSNSSNKVPF